MATPETISVIGTLSGAIVGGIIGWVGSYINSTTILRKQEFNKAATGFRCAFIKELRYLDYRYSPDRRGNPGIYKILSDGFDTHEIAFTKFRPYLCPVQRLSFDKAWNDYCDKGENKKPRFIEYAEPDRLGDMIEAQKFFLEKLNTLLKFADLKH